MTLFVTPESTLSYWRRNIAAVDPFLLAMARELVQPNTVVWDVGANVGLFSFAAAALGAQVMAVEPDPWLANLIHRSTQLNQLPVKVLPAAVSDRRGTCQLHTPTEGRSSNSLDGDGAGQPVITMTLDSLLDYFPAPNVLKIDIEGMELPVLRAGQKVLEARPRILCEVTAHHEAVASVLRDAHYEFFAARAANRQPLQRPSRDTLAIPR